MIHVEAMERRRDSSSSPDSHSMIQSPTRSTILPGRQAGQVVRQSALDYLAPNEYLVAQEAA